MAGLTSLPHELHGEIAKHLGDHVNIDAADHGIAAFQGLQIMARFFDQPESRPYQENLFRNVVLIDHVNTTKLVRSLIETPDLRRRVKSL